MEELRKLEKELDKVIEKFNTEIDKLQVKAQEVSDKIEENIEKAKEVELPGRVPEGEKYWFISNDWDFAVDFETETNDIDDNYLYDIGNYFKTEQDAKQALEEAMIYAKLKRFAEKHNAKEIDWGNSSQSKYYFYYAYGMKELLISHVTNLRIGKTVYFTSEKIARKAIEEIGEENIKKLFI